MTVRDELKAIIETDSSRGRAFDICVQLLIVISLVAFAMETLPGLPVAVKRTLAAIEFSSVLIFSLEYVCRLWVAERRLEFATSFFGIIDLCATLPSLLLLGADLRALRAFRLVRLFRILKLARYSKAIQRFHRAFIIAREEIVLFLFVTGILLFLSAVGIYHFEHESQPEVFTSIPHSLWWATATLTTVGYGDAYPITAGGKFFTGLMLFVGLGIVSVPAGLVASALSKARELED